MVGKERDIDEGEGQKTVKYHLCIWKCNCHYPSGGIVVPMYVRLWVSDSSVSMSLAGFFKFGIWRIVADICCPCLDYVGCVSFLGVEKSLGTDSLIWAYPYLFSCQSQICG